MGLLQGLCVAWTSHSIVVGAWLWEASPRAGSGDPDQVLSGEPSNRQLLDAWQRYRHPVDQDSAGLEDALTSGWAKPRWVRRERELSREDYQQDFEGRVPVVLEGVYEDMSCLQDGWLERVIVKPYGSERVVFKGRQDTIEKVMSTPLRTFIKHIDKNRQHAWSYLEDNLLVARHPELLRGCPPVPSFLRGEDYFDFLPTNLKPVNATLLWGGKYSRSSLHVDIYNLTGTSVVLRGEKHWRLIPPGSHDRKLFPKLMSCGAALGCISYESAVDLFGPPVPRGLPLWEATLRAGDALVIPSGWWHQAVNMARETVSLSSGIITPRSGAWSAIAEVVKYNAKAHPDWIWGRLPAPPADGVLGLEPEQAKLLFRSFVDALPEGIFKAADEWVNKMKSQEGMKRKANEL